MIVTMAASKVLMWVLIIIICCILERPVEMQCLQRGMIYMYFQGIYFTSLLISDMIILQNLVQVNFSTRSFLWLGLQLFVQFVLLFTHSSTLLLCAYHTVRL